MPLIATRGAASAQGFGEFAQSAAPNYIEDVFSTWLYTGTGASQTHTNNIDLAGKGGLVWLKRRSGVESHYLQDSSSGFANSISSNSTAAQITGSGIITAVSSTGFTTSSVSSGTTYASWTFREQPKFFDCVTYTGDGVAGRAIPHNLGSTPGFIVVKKTSGLGNWLVWHRSVPSNNGQLNTTDPINFAGYIYSPTSTVFNVFGDTNESGQTYVAYLFAHDAGGFGLTGTDNVISCGAFTTDGSGNASVTLGYEPQWVLSKPTAISSDWQLADSMRGMSVGIAQAALAPNLSDSETTGFVISPTATGFNVSGSTGGVARIYIAIRRGPMRVPTTGTSVFQPVARTGTGSTATVSTSLSYVDLALLSARTGSVVQMFFDRLRGATRFVFSSGICRCVGKWVDVWFIH
jgi:hypothetical protein